jgi:uncharacterized membrane protein
LPRNCSLAPRQLIATFTALGLVALGIALLFWLHGATLILPFAWVEVLALAAALVVYARHAGDGERLLLRQGRLMVESTDGARTQRVEFDAASVRVEAGYGERSLIRLSGQGRHVAVGQFVRSELREVLVRELRVAMPSSPRAGPVPPTPRGGSRCPAEPDRPERHRTTESGTEFWPE